MGCKCSCHLLCLSSHPLSRERATKHSGILSSGTTGCIYGRDLRHVLRSSSVDHALSPTYSALHSNSRRLRCSVPRRGDAVGSLRQQRRCPRRGSRSRRPCRGPPAARGGSRCSIFPAVHGVQSAFVQRRAHVVGTVEPAGGSSAPLAGKALPVRLSRSARVVLAARERQ